MERICCPLTGGDGEGGGGLGLGLKRIERFERTVLAASSCKPFPIAKFLILPFSVQFLTLKTVELCYWHPVVPVFSEVKANERPGAPKKREGL